MLFRILLDTRYDLVLPVHYQVIPTHYLDIQMTHFEWQSWTDLESYLQDPLFNSKLVVNDIFREWRQGQNIDFALDHDHTVLTANPSSDPMLSKDPAKRFPSSSSNHTPIQTHTLSLSQVENNRTRIKCKIMELSCHPKDLNECYVYSSK